MTTIKKQSAAVAGNTASAQSASLLRGEADSIETGETVAKPKSEDSQKPDAVATGVAMVAPTTKPKTKSKPKPARKAVSRARHK